MATGSSLEDLNVNRLLRSLFADDWVFKTGIGGILGAGSIVAGLYSFMCIPIVAALWALMIGYCLRCIRFKVLNPDCRLPDWNDWGDLFLSGITWMAFQTIVWTFVCGIAFGIIFFSGAYAVVAKTSVESNVEVILGCIIASMILFKAAFLSAFVMVNFAIEENASAGFSYIKVAQRIWAEPQKYLSGFMLAMGLQWGAIIFPCLTIVGVFLIPSTYFVGQATSAAVLARTWSTTPLTESEKAAAAAKRLKKTES